MQNLNNLLSQADNLRFKILSIIGKEEAKRDKIISVLKENGWITVDVGKELLSVKQQLDNTESEKSFELASQIKDWFSSKPNNLILLNAGILYHELFLKISPVGAFKYNSRNKNCVLFLEDETRLGNRVYYGEVGSKEYFDQEINDILIVDINEISDDYTMTAEKKDVSKEMTPDSIGNFFDFHQIKDVVDIDSDLKEPDKRRGLVSSYILSPSLEEQITDFFDDLEKPVHKARTVIGNYGSGKSHLVGFLVSLVDDPAIADLVNSASIKQAVSRIGRNFYHVQFELQSGQVPLKTWFYGKTKKQLKNKYGIDIPEFDHVKDFDDKDNIQKIVEIIKEQDSTAGLMVVIDEVSDFLSSKQKSDMKADLQFLRVLGQVCQDQDFMFLGSMQEDVFTSPKFKDIASEIGRVSERFQNIIIHKEDVRKVISKRIVPKSGEQRHELEGRMDIFAEKIESVSVNLNEYIDLFPLTPFLLELFTSLPYFEKRGVIQFAISEIKQRIYEPFPSFFTFERIYDLLADNPNKKNIEEIHEIKKVIDILEQKVLLLEVKYRNDALMLVKALAVYSLWDQKESGATSEELANHLMIIPSNKLLSARDHIELVIKKIREVTDGNYIKLIKPEGSETVYFKFETSIKTGIDETIQMKAAAVSEDEIEDEIFRQLKDLLELENYKGAPDVFYNECSWPSVKSYREGLLYFVKKNTNIKKFEEKDFAVAVISPFADNFDKKLSDRQIDIKFHIPDPENVEIIKEVVAIRELINKNIQISLASKKLEQRINGYKMGTQNITGVRYRIAKLLINYAECRYNKVDESIKNHLGRESASVPEIIDQLKVSILDKEFTDYFIGHPVYASKISGTTAANTATGICHDLASGNFSNLSRATSQFLERLSLLNKQGYPDHEKSQVAQKILEIIKGNGSKVTDINEQIVNYFKNSKYGIEPEIIYIYLIFFTVQGKVFLQIRGGEKWDINNIKEEFKSVSQFENILYVKMSEDLSYDFAQRLMNSLGLNGALIRNDKDRPSAFSLYKQKIAAILKELSTLEHIVENIKTYNKIHIDAKAVEEKLLEIKEIPWDSLDISNFTRFGTIENLNSRLSEIELGLRDIANMIDALAEYENIIHSSVSYMEDALALIDENSIINSDKKKTDSLNQIYQEVIGICGDFEKYFNKSERNPLKGKIEAFKKTFKYDVYIPAHNKYVGSHIDWKVLDEYSSDPSFIKLQKLYNIKLLSGGGAFNARVASWLELKKYKCENKLLDNQLDYSVFCQECLFPKKEKYTEIQGIIDGIEEQIEEMCSKAEKNIVNLVREYRDNVQYLAEDEKQIISSLLESKKLPDILPSKLIQAVNNLTKEVDVIEVSSDDILDNLFPENKTVSISELSEGFSAFINSIKHNKDEREIRIKLK